MIRSGATLLAALLAAPLAAVDVNAVSNSPQSPRDFYNLGTQQLRDKKLRDAEGSLQSAVLSNDEKVQPPALYNLGIVRFQQGAEALKQAPNAEAARAQGQGATELADRAIQAARTGLAGDDLDALVSAYRAGRGARKELKSAMEVVKKALAAHGAVLSRWQRSSGDFKSAYELQPKRDEARFNADVVDRNIAALVDKQELLMQCMNGMGDKRKELAELMKKLKGRIPGGDLPKAPGDEEEDDEGKDGQKPPDGPQAGHEEKQGDEGKEMSLTPEEAMRLLESLKLDSNRKLPMGDQETAPPRDPKRREW